MKVIDKPCGRETDFVGGLRYTCHHLIGFNGVLDACQFHVPALRQGHTKL
jgi:hypothetical protein